MSLTRVCYISRAVPHYRSAILSRLSACCDLTILSGGTTLGLGDDVALSNLRTVPLQIIRSPWGKGRLYLQKIRYEVRKSRPEIVICEFGLSLLHLHWLLWMRRRLGFKLAFWTHGMGVDYQGPARSIADRFRVRLLRSADGLFYYTGRCKEALRVDIGDRVPSWVVWNTLDSEAINVQWNAMRGSVSTVEEPYVLYLGRLVDSKRTDELPALARRLKILVPNLRWKVVGAGEMRDRLERIASAEDLPMDFLGPITDEQTKGLWIKHALVMVCPGMLGLNVVDALGYGCPVLSYRSQPYQTRHSPEMEYIHEGADGNGWLVADEEELINTLVRLHKNPSLRAEMGIKARETFMRECQVERQMAGFLDGIHSLSREVQRAR